MASEKRTVFQLRIVLDNIHPSIWRRFLVPGEITIAKFHLFLQSIMGWTNSHLHYFDFGGVEISPDFQDWPEDTVDEDSISLNEALADLKHFSYTYDFGDTWSHHLVLEHVTEQPLVLRYAVVLDGDRACPPEDVGGPHGYEYLCQVLKDPLTDEYEHFNTWSGGSYDPEAFSLPFVNSKLQQISQKLP